MRSVLTAALWRTPNSASPTFTADRRARPATLLVLVAAAIAAAAMLAQGASGLMPDSVTYLDMASQWRAGQGLTHRWAYWDPVYETARLPTHTSMWPPGYSILIALAATVTGSLQVAAKLVSAISFGLLAIPLYGLARVLVHADLALVAAAAAMCAAPLVMCATAIAAEATFLLLFAASLGFATQALYAREARAAGVWLLFAGICAGASVWIRYVGLGAVAGVVLVAALRARTAAKRETAPLLAAGGAPAIALAAALFLRERWVSGGLPLSWPGGQIFWSTLDDAGRGIVAELVSSPSALGLLPWMILVIVQAVALLVLLVSATRNPPASAECDPSGGRRAGPFFAAVAAFLIPYLAVMIAARHASGMNIEPRFVTILAPIVAVAFFAAAQRGAANRGRRGAAIASIALLAACQALVSATRMDLAEDNYIARARGSDWLAWIAPRTSPREPLLATRGAELACCLPNPVLRLPRLPYSRRSAANWNDVDDLADRFGARLLVHGVGQRGVGRFDPEAQRWLESLDRPEAHHERVLASFPDCIVYRVGRGCAGDARGGP